jgi:hypothetical protein
MIEYFNSYLENIDSNDINKKYNNFINNISQELINMPNFILYGPPGSGKYSDSLKIVRKFSKSDLKYEKKMIINSQKNEHIIKISDIHYEINLENLTCNSKTLFNDIYNNIIDSISMYNNNLGIIIIKNFDMINNELLEIFYSYMQKIINRTLVLKFIILTENISFIPNNILESCKILYYSKLSLTKYIKIANKNNRKLLNKLSNVKINNKITNNDTNDNINNNDNENIKNNYKKINFIYNNINNINLLKNFDLNEINLNIINLKGNICDKIAIFIINNLYIDTINYKFLRNLLYDILIYNLNIYECIFEILEKIYEYFIEYNSIKNNSINNNVNYAIIINNYSEFLNRIFLKTNIFLKYYNNNYRPIYHLESYVLYIISTIQNINENK